MDARNKEIIRLFHDCVRGNMSFMDAYYYCAEEYGLEVSSIQKIIRKARSQIPDAKCGKLS